MFVHLTSRSTRARKLLEDAPRVLAEHGRPLPHALRREAITVSELRSAARERGFSDLEEVELVVLETNGHLAVMGREAAERWRSEQP